MLNRAQSSVHSSVVGNYVSEDNNENSAKPIGLVDNHLGVCVCTFSLYIQGLTLGSTLRIKRVYTMAVVIINL